MITGKYIELSVSKKHVNKHVKEIYNIKREYVTKAKAFC